MKELNDKSLESLIETVTKVKLPYWAKTTIAVSVGVAPLLKVLAPLIMLSTVLNFLARLLGL